jgi:uncharacterized coiled-coil protein SlyX
MARHSTQDLDPAARMERLEDHMATLTDVIAELAAKIDDIEAAAQQQNDQAISDITALTERAHEVLTGIRAQSEGLADPQGGDGVTVHDTGTTDHAMGDSHRELPGAQVPQQSV